MPRARSRSPSVRGVVHLSSRCGVLWLGVMTIRVMMVTMVMMVMAEMNIVLFDAPWENTNESQKRYCCTYNTQSESQSFESSHQVQ